MTYNPRPGLSKSEAILWNCLIAALIVFGGLSLLSALLRIWVALHGGEITR